MSTSNSLTDELLEIGVVRRAHGLRGDVAVELTTDRLERTAPGARWFVAGEWLTIASAHPHGTRWLVSFAEVVSRPAAERLTNAIARAEPLDDPDALWVHDLIGAEVVEVSGVCRGAVTAVVANPAADLLELDGGALVPTVFVVERRDGIVVIDPPDGLFDDAGADDGDGGDDGHTG